MEKLIKLIDEYEFKGRNWKGGSWIKSDKDVFLKQEYIIGKRYGFIQWLVDNDKIDLLRLDNRIVLSEFNKVERVLMALSIQDNPIEFLVMILK